MGNTYNLPTGKPLWKALTHAFKQHLKVTLAAIPPATAPLPTHFPPLTDYTDPMAAAMTPLLSVYWDEAGKGVREAMGLDPGPWQVTDPHLHAQIHKQAFAFCDATNKTTDLALSDALKALRRELVAGLVTEGDSIPALTKRVKKVFNHAETYRARRIAQTEAARAVHAAQYESVKESGVASGVRWLISANSCPLCVRIAAEVGQVKLGTDFAKIGNNPHYSAVPHPPAHPSCRCSVQWILLPEYGGPEDVQWGTPLVDPEASADYVPPAGVPMPEPEPDAKPPVVVPPKPVETTPHPHVPDRIDVPKTPAEPTQDYLPEPVASPVPAPASAPKPKPPKTPKPKPAPKPKPVPLVVAAPAPAPVPPPKPKPSPIPGFPGDLDGLEVVRSLGGSTGAQLVRDPVTGSLFVLKRGASPDHLKEEATADALYRVLGLSVPQSHVYTTDRGPAKLAAYVPGQTLGELRAADHVAYEKAVATLRKGFVADALLGNWDVVGLGLDNVLVDAQGTVYRIDNGGSLRYRAQGAKKSPAQWSGLVAELASLRDASLNPSAGLVFAGLTDAEIDAQIAGVLKHRKALLAAAPAALRDTLASRLDSLAGRIAKPAKDPVTPAWTPTPADVFRTFTDGQVLEKWGDTHFSAWSASLSSGERSSLIAYWGDHYKWMNVLARGGTWAEAQDVIREEYIEIDVSEASARKMVGQVAAALRRAKAPEPILVWRGIRDAVAARVDLGSLRPGSKLTDRQFGSTSLSQGVAKRFAHMGPTTSTRVVFEIRVPAGTPGAWAEVDELTPNLGELEFTLPPGVEYRVVEVLPTAPDATYTKVILEIAP